MKMGVTMLIAGAMGVVVLCGCLASTYLSKTVASPRAEERALLGVPLTERQILERRRANVGTVAIAGTTTR